MPRLDAGRVVDQPDCHAGNDLGSLKRHVGEIHHFWRPDTVVSTVLQICVLLGAASLTAWAMDVAVAERMSRTAGRALPPSAEWTAMCRRIHTRFMWPGAVSVLSALAASAYLADDRWQVGAALMIGALCYTWDRIVPASQVLHTVDPSRAATLHLTRARFRTYAMQHYPLIALGLSALVAFAWAHS
jgi:hypothetical protein